MKTRAPAAALCAAIVLAGGMSAAADSSPWRDVAERSLLPGGERVIVPLRYRMLALDRDALFETLAQAPLEFTREAAETASMVQVALPMPDGTWERFRVEESPIMEPGLARRVPEIRTYRGQGLDDPTATTRFGWTSAGFHAIVLSESGTVYIDPYRRGDAVHHISYAKQDFVREDAFRCLVDDARDRRFDGPAGPLAFAPSGDTLRTYRLALAADVEYSDFHSTQSPPDPLDVLSNGIVPTLNRVDAIYERDVAVRMVLVANELSIIFVNEPDGYTNGDPQQMRNANQGIVDALIGDANYDVGHVFGTAGGGIAAIQIPCLTSVKARAATGITSPTGDPFNIDYVAHEMGHQFGANHTFNSVSGFCGSSRFGPRAYEVGAGSTIMSYSGICAPDNLQTHSDDLFHNASFGEIQAYTTNPATGDSCPVHAVTGNRPPVVDAGPAFNIPSRTPFALTATGSDPDGDPLTYAWEEFDLGPGNDGRADNGASPIFRAFKGTAGPTRVFPRLADILSNTTTYGELLPTTTRTMTFRVTARDNRAGGGGVEWDSTTVSVQGAAGPFAVTAPNTAVTWIPNTTQTVTWNVAGTNAAPINTTNVDILLSSDGGLSFPVMLAANTPNDGSQQVTVPNVPGTTTRVKVHAAGNVYFDISDVNFTIASIAQFAVPASLAMDGSGNRVLQAGETASMEPAWRNAGTSTLAGATGALSGFTGPAGPTYTIVDGTAAYGTIPVGATASCTASGDCYALAMAAASRPLPHWDAQVDEAIAPSGNLKRWVLHVGDSFTDVPATSPFYRFVETILHKDVTGGCTGTAYCPAASTTREAMAVFVLASKEPAGYAPPPCAVTPMFSDVPVSSPFCAWIEELASRGVVTGCTPTAYCPTAAATREQMAVFVLVTLDPAMNPPPCASAPYGDVPAASPFCRWILELTNRGVVTGCGGGNYCPTASVSREQMSVFLSVTFGLALYGV